MKEKLSDKPNEQCSALELVEEINKYDPETAWDQRGTTTLYIPAEDLAVPEEVPSHE